MSQPQVLISGAGPTGLVLGLWLARRGVPFRIIEKNAAPGEASRAMVVQARTLEFYRQLGFADEVVRRGIKVEKLQMREGAREVASIPFGDLGEGLSPFPFALSFPQDDHEKLLIEQLRLAGADVEWNTELASFTQSDTGVSAVLRKQGVEEAVEAAYLCGCDGAHSIVRQGLGLGFPGGTYEQVFYVADVEAEDLAATNSITVCLSSAGFCVVFPVRSTAQHRLIGTLPDDLARRENVSFEDVRPHAENLVGIHVRKVNWFSSYRVHHRVADRFRSRRVFIAGDAAHIHSPAGGQGMNTGIGDAVNLAWKVAAVIEGKAEQSLLDSYEAERIPFARSLVASTDKLFQAMVGRNLGADIFRSMLPYLLPFLMGFPAIRRAQFLLVSQTRINYRESPLSKGRAGDIHGGDRLPWVDGPNGGNFAPLRSLDWQIHVYGEPKEIAETAHHRHLPLHAFPWSDVAERAGLLRDAAYLVRPDGHVASAFPSQADAAQSMDAIPDAG